MSKIRNVSRYWVDKDSQIIMRKWTDEEYVSVDPNKHIFEKYWYCHCLKCQSIPIPYCSKEEAKHNSNNHKRHICLIRRKYFELVCYELKEEYSKDYDIWIPTYTMYWDKDRV